MKTLSKTSIAAAFLVALSFAPMQVHAGIFSDDEARKAILDIRGKMDALGREVNTRLESKSDKTSALDQLNQNEQLRQEIAKLRGQIEVLTNELANTQQRQKDFYVDLDNRLRALEPQKVTVDGKETTVEQDELKIYNTALAQFKAGEYKDAGALFFDFLRRYPQSGYAAAAQYWLGNSFYAQREYRNAITAQQALVKNYPDSPKVPDALLNIASCFSELKDKVSAKKTLETLIAQHGNSSAAQTAKERLAAMK